MGNVKSNVILRPSTISLHKSSLGKGNNVYSIQSKANVIFNISVFIVFTNNIYAAFTTIFLSLMDDLEWKNRSSHCTSFATTLCVKTHLFSGGIGCGLLLCVVFC